MRRKTSAGLAGASSGNLTFSCDFEGGNIGFARMADNGLEYDINVREDTYGPKHRLWYHFQMHGGAQGKCCLSSSMSIVHDSVTGTILGSILSGLH